MQRLEELRNFKRATGHCSVPMKFPSNPVLLDLQNGEKGLKNGGKRREIWVAKQKAKVQKRHEKRMALELRGVCLTRGRIQCFALIQFRACPAVYAFSCFF